MIIFRVLFLLVCISSLHATILHATIPPIDIVYTWVDGTDEAWQKERARFTTDTTLQSSDANSLVRFRDKGELKYSLRSIMMFAPFVNHIFIVTCGQRPKWLQDHPKITIVHQDEIFKNKDDLPTFNSMAIECNLHRIPNLSEYYIYLNDDFFLGKPTTPLDFFTEKGAVRVFLTESPLPFGPYSSWDNGWTLAAKNTRNLLARLQFRAPFAKLEHAPYSAKKSLVERAEKTFSSIFSRVSSHRFRSQKDYLITNGLIPFFMIEEDEGISCFNSDTMYFEYKNNFLENRRSLENIAARHPTFFCIQDCTESCDDENLSTLHDFFEKYYPTQAPWEFLKQ